MIIKKIFYLLLILFFINLGFAVNVSVEWNQTVNSGDSDEPFSIAIDSNSNSYAVGYIGQNSYVVSYDVNGNFRWQKNISQGAFLYVDVDSNGNSYMTGEYNNGSGDRAFFLISYDTNGNYRWNSTLNVLGTYDYGSTLSFDNSDNIYVPGALGNGTSGQFFAISYDTNGNQRWNNTIYNKSGEAYNSKVDSNSNSYFLGRMNGSTYGAFSYDLLRPNNNLWYSDHGMGLVYTSASNAAPSGNIHALMRSGGWNYGVAVGPYMVHLNAAPQYVSGALGFRCVYTP